MLADNDEALRRLLRRVIGLVAAVEIVGEAADGLGAVELVLSLAPEIVLLDCEMPGLDGPSAGQVILSRRPQTRILLHSGGRARKCERRPPPLG